MQVERLWADADTDVQPLVAESRGKIGR